MSPTNSKRQTSQTTTTDKIFASSRETAIAERRISVVCTAGEIWGQVTAERSASRLAWKSWRTSRHRPFGRGWSGQNSSIERTITSYQLLTLQEAWEVRPADGRKPCAPLPAVPWYNSTRDREHGNVWKLNKLHYTLHVAWRESVVKGKHIELRDPISGAIEVRAQAPEQTEQSAVEQLISAPPLAAEVAVG